MTSRRARLAAGGLALALVAGVLTVATPASAATNPAHSLAAARTHTPIAVGRWTRDSLRTSSQQNWYRLVLTKPGYLSVVLGDLPRNYNLGLYSSTGHRIAVSDAAGLRFEDVDLPHAAGGTYFLRVASTSGASTAEYSLGVRFLTNTVEALSTSTAGGVVYGEWVNNGSSWVVVQSLNLRYFNAAGALLRADNDVAVSEGFFYLPPHGRVPFGVFPTVAGVPRGTARVTVTPQPVVVPARSVVRLTSAVTSVTFPTTPSGAHLLRVRGTISNRSTRVASLPTAVLEVFTSRGVLSGLARDQRPSLGAGRSEPFDAEFAFYDQVPSPRYRAVQVLESTNGV